VGQPRIAQLVKTAGSAITRFGAARSSRYGTARLPNPNPRPLPLYCVEAQDAATLRLVGEVVALAPAPNGDVLVRWEDGGSSGELLHEGFPCFLADMTPQGFLGRTFAHQNPLLQLPPDVSRWSSDNVFHALSNAGHDMSGAWIVGEAAAEKWLAARHAGEDAAAPLGGPAVPQRGRAAAFEKLATQTMNGAPPGSSAGGEQPKFLCRVKTVPSASTAAGTSGVRAVIVKFSPPRETSAGTRWADLLCAEHLAQTVLAEAGLPAARTRLVRGATRTFLEVERFDRIGAFGRRPFVSFKALAMARDGDIGDTWFGLAQAFRDAGFVGEKTVAQTRLLAAFAAQIHNTDTHPGNIALQPVEAAELSLLGDAPRLELAPAYDMLPMRYRPSPQDGVTMDNSPAAPPPPSPSLLPAWDEAAQLAARFRERLLADETISPKFRALWK
jgi:hypothetical protein